MTLNARILRGLLRRVRLRCTEEDRLLRDFIPEALRKRVCKRGSGDVTFRLPNQARETGWKETSPRPRSSREQSPKTRRCGRRWRRGFRAKVQGSWGQVGDRLLPRCCPTHLAPPRHAVEVRDFSSGQGPSSVWRIPAPSSPTPSSATSRHGWRFLPPRVAPGVRVRLRGRIRRPSHLLIHAFPLYLSAR